MKKRWPRIVSWIALIVFGAVVQLASTQASAQSEVFERTVRDCMDNGFPRSKCTSQAEKADNVERSEAERYRRERQRRLEKPSRPPRPRRRHPGRRSTRP